MYLLDTDHIVILQQQSQPEFANLLGRVLQHQAGEFYVSIVSFHEQVMGWNAYLSRARASAGVVQGYHRFQQMLANYCDALIAPFDQSAADHFDDLRKQRIRIGTMDLRIAATALSKGMTL